MTPLFRRTHARQRRQISHGAPRRLSPHVMRDIGFDPWPERPRLPFHLLW